MFSQVCSQLLIQTRYHVFSKLDIHVRYVSKTAIIHQEQKLSGITKPVLVKSRIGFVGAGNLNKSIVKGMLEANVIKPDQICVSAPSNTNLPFWKELGIETTHSNAHVIKKSNVVILGMKPQYLDDAIKTFDPEPNDKLYVSVLGGVSIAVLNQKLRTHFNYTGDGIEPWRVVRTLPNTPTRVGAGITPYSVSVSTTSEDSELVKAIFSSGGLCELIPEHLMNAVGALSASGPAFLYLVIEGLCDGVVKMGVPRALATDLACQTLFGAAKMVKETGKHPGQLKDEVCTPGGQTIAGVHSLEKDGVRAALINAIETATKRAFELGSK